ncbi:helix-turn-helix transcriptional regulator [Kineosporia babensis]|uniref:Uncharacterized protein n=1 Tax=Kineosporia babensis TaxID=499548 RepID=A0A9X1NCR5_9ACTN|nr:hypothetical protein [Kineosporia babensis]MCD5310866.1 hypothetical protein [Kineosporia babensis]
MRPLGEHDTHEAALAAVQAGHDDAWRTLRAWLATYVAGAWTLASEELSIIEEDRLPGPAVAELLGIASGTWRGYVSRGQAPAPDGRSGDGRPYWTTATLDAWDRPGQGARTDLHTDDPQGETMSTTTSFGSWVSADATNLTVEESIASYLSGGDIDWLARMEESGAVDAMAADYRAAINEALPDGVSLAGNEFYGPHAPHERAWDGYPVTEDGDLDLAAIVEGIDLAPILERHDVSS